MSEQNMPHQETPDAGHPPATLVREVLSILEAILTAKGIDGGERADRLREVVERCEITSPDVLASVQRAS